MLRKVNKRACYSFMMPNVLGNLLNGSKAKFLYIQSLRSYFHCLDDMASYTAFFLALVTGILSLCAPTASGGEAIDLEALSSFKISITSDPLDALANWRNLTHHCNWPGVACDSRRSVVSLILPEKQLEGVISPFIANISYLTYLDLSSNSFRGSIPFCLGKLGRLQSLSLASNVLDGSIPETIGNCISLTTASLSNNKLSGHIPSALGGCKKLRGLDLSSNVLEGMIPVNISQLLNLEQLLNLSNNRLEGVIPAEIGRLSLLSSLDLSSNMLSGRIPSELGNLTKLRYLNISRNHLEGPVPQIGVLASFNWSNFEGNDELCGVSDSSPCSKVARSHQHRRHTAMVASVVSVCVFLALLFCFVFYCICLRDRHRTTLIEYNPYPDPNYKKSYLQERTDSFNAENIIGSSSGSIVYKGGNIAVNVYKTDCSRQTDFFYRYIGSLLKIRHRNLLNVVGFCREESFYALVTEYEPNGHLDTLMHAARMEDRRMTFDLSKRIDVLISTAGALIHLHEYCQSRIVHGHLKPTNIYLDEHFRFRVGGFGTLELLQDHLQQERKASSAMEGTISYLAPELADMERVTPKADVFSLGVILMEMLTGRKAPASLETESGERISLRQWIEKGINGGSLATLADPALGQNISERESERKKIADLFKISLLCTEEIVESRPTMSQVLAWLDNIKHDRVDSNTGI
ncbi:LRR receptor-like serine/threonine-protein kinase FLS2 [Cryptomeria japonica]|uniref:LRR receptor-like serine/threonine-protein kinase FLS2 n=1 Tax=Cryptomeria japonica TaxID=3369 RepID=UPI0027DA48D6|nr:LRR receptor-like serine/threonine-protein kinase FLS2 [Cryptomeria japonica]